MFSKLREARDPDSRDKAVKIAVKEMLGRSPSLFRAGCECNLYSAFLVRRKPRYASQ